MNKVYDFMKTAESICEATVHGLYRSKGKGATIEFEFRLDRSCYDKDGNDNGPIIRWKVRYMIREGSRYVKVTWTPFDYQKNIENWQELADHDSCWHHCWDEPIAYGRKVLEEEFNIKGNESWFFNCESVTEIEE